MRSAVRVAGVAARWLFVACLPVLLVTASLAWAVNSFWVYQHGLEKYNISQVTGLPQSELDKAATALIRYFNSSERDISLTVTKDGRPFQLFNEREVVHLRDVKDLIWLDYRVLLATLLYSAVYAAASIMRRRGRQLARAALFGGGLTLALTAALGVAMTLDFGGLFLQFHLISFSNDFWQLDPTRDYLIKMFPEDFWYDAAKYIALATACLAMLVAGSSALYLKLSRRTELR